MIDWLIYYLLSYSDSSLLFTVLLKVGDGGTCPRGWESWLLYLLDSISRLHFFLLLGKLVEIAGTSDILYQFRSEFKLFSWICLKTFIIHTTRKKISEVPFYFSHHSIIIIHNIHCTSHTVTEAPKAGHTIEVDRSLHRNSS